MMKPLVITHQFESSPEDVFEVLAHIEIASEIIPKISEATILTEQRRGVGGTFRRDASNGTA